MSTTFVHGIEHFKRRESRTVVATIGTFDGIHLGHQEILRSLHRAGEKDGVEPVLITFDPHPRVLVSPHDIPLLLTTKEEKEKFIPAFLNGLVLVLDFDEKMMNMEAADFVKEILLDRVGVRKLIVGYDHALGKDRKGTIPQLKQLGRELGYDVEVCQPVIIDGQPVSSSRVRRAMTQGRYQEALRLLGHDYAVCGVVEKGINKGRELGYPTANVRCSPRKLLPAEGVYTCRAEVARQCRQGVMFIGYNHFNPENRLSVEAHLFDFDQDIYEQEITVYPVHFLRANRKFDSPEKLIRQIGKDIEKTLQILSKEKRHVADKRAEGPDYCGKPSSRQ